MFLNFLFKFFFFFFLMFSIFISLSLTDLFLIWLLMEINNFMYISLLSLSIKNKKIIFFYFIIQFIPSSILILIFSLNLLFLNNMFFILMNFMSLLIKLGIPPFHLWMPLISKYLNWFSLFILLTLQKIIPFYLITFIFPLLSNNFFFYLVIILSSLIPLINMINLLNFKNLLTYSSINQSSWLLLLLNLKNSFWLIYHLIYMKIILLIIFLITYNNLIFNFSNKNKLNMNILFNFLLLSMFLNLASLPPFSFFILKWYNIFLSLMNSNLYMLLIFLMFSSFIILFIYINMISQMMFFWISKLKFIYLNNSMNFNLTLFFFLFINFFLSIIILLI